MERLLCVVIGYCFGMIQTAFIYGKAHGIDIREHGSGNSGTTNALRVLGKKAGLAVMTLDILKVTLAIFSTSFFKNQDILRKRTMKYRKRVSRSPEPFRLPLPFFASKQKRIKGK